MKRILLLLPLLWETRGMAFGFPETRSLPVAPEATDWTAASYDFEGIVALSNCSGSLVRFDDSNDEDQGLILTNGHCTGSLIDPGKVVVDQSSNRNFDVLNSQAKKIGTLHAERLLYGTMTRTDLSLYRVRETYAEIEKTLQTRALVLGRQSPEEGEAIEILSGYWKRGYACSIEHIVPTLQEGRWLFSESLRYSRPGCDTIGGTSGSPVLAAGTRTVVAVNNTGNDGGKACSVNNPCELEGEGKVIAQKGYSYAQQTAWLYGCRNAEGGLDLKQSTCKLPKLAP